MAADPQTGLISEIARLEASLEHTARATEGALATRWPPAPDDGRRSPAAERTELCRQLAALRERVACAHARREGPQALRAELATLLSFATTLQADADRWRSALAEQLEALERQRAAARAEQDRLAAQREQLVCRRDALQSTILQTAAGMAERGRGEWRRSVPVISLGEGLTVCSVSVSCRRRWWRLADHWLVTLSRSHDVLVRRE